MKKITGPFGEKITIQKKLSKKILSFKDGTYFVDSFFKGKIIFKDGARVKYLTAGENLKTMKSFEEAVGFLVKSGHSKKEPIICIGGGSLGDFVGFVASVYLRGVPFYSVPTTWLSVIDSSIGGKTALNFDKYKNQIGSFYAPQEIHISSDILRTSNLDDAKGEILKTLFLNLNKKWAKEQLNSFISLNLEKYVSYKIQVVKKDIKDETGVRAVLNLGHTLAHAFELEFGLSHSESVLKGLQFALNWSLKLGMLSTNKHKSLYHNISASPFRFTAKNKLQSYLRRDKKKVKEKINFIFLSDKGPLIKKVKIESITDEYFRQVKENEI